MKNDEMELLARELGLMKHLMLEQQPVLKQVRKITLGLLRGTGARVYLFGSWARGENRMASDIDIAIEHEGQIGVELFIAIKEALEESTVPYRVDVVDLTRADPALVNAVREEGILWSD